MRILGLFRKRSRREICGEDNQVSVTSEIDDRHLSVKIHGSRNKVRIASGVKIRGFVNIVVVGDDNEILIGENVVVIDRLYISILKDCRRGRVSIGEGSSFWNTTIQNYDSGSSVTIGKDCMFSYDTTVTNTDEHLILKDGIVCNKARDLVIGNHVWVGYRGCVLKNSRVADGSIIGRSAVVSGVFDETKSVIVGNPGRVVKTGVDWLRSDVNQEPGS